MERTGKQAYLMFFYLLSILAFISACARPEISYHEYTNIDLSYPEQEMIENPQLININRGKDNYLIVPQAQYRIGAVVRSKRAYRFDRMAKISPFDFALVWGFLADEHFYRQLKITQGGRRYFFRPKKGAQMSVDWIYINSSNNHIIPANDNIRRALRTVRKNDHVLIEGYLVNVTATIKGKSFTWRTSLSREDKGDGACEIIYVKRIKVNYRVYE